MRMPEGDHSSAPRRPRHRRRNSDESQSTTMSQFEILGPPSTIPTHRSTARERAPVLSAIQEERERSSSVSSPVYGMPNVSTYHNMLIQMAADLSGRCPHRASRCQALPLRCLPRVLTYLCLLHSSHLRTRHILRYPHIVLPPILRTRRQRVWGGIGAPTVSQGPVHKITDMLYPNSVLGRRPARLMMPTATAVRTITIVLVRKIAPLGTQPRRACIVPLLQTLLHVTKGPTAVLALTEQIHRAMYIRIAHLAQAACVAIPAVTTSPGAARAVISEGDRAWTTRRACRTYMHLHGHRTRLRTHQRSQWWPRSRACGRLLLNQPPTAAACPLTKSTSRSSHP